MDKHRDEHGVEPICKALQIDPSTYYARRSRPESARAASDRELGEKIESIHAGNCGVYGARKVHKELHRQDIPAARCTVERLMRQKGLRGISRSKGPRTTRPAPEPAGPRTWSSAGSRQQRRTGCGLQTSRMSARLPAGSTRRLSSTCSPAGSLAGRWPRAFIPTWRWTLWRWASGPRTRDGADLTGLVHHSDYAEVIVNPGFS